jgi:FMN phosphatase YigB (HAD superfamily)
MFYKGVILDLDNTIYDYDKCHKIALANVFKIINSDEYDLEYVQKSYNQISTRLKNELKNTASSHNKGIYFKHLLEYLQIDYTLLSRMNSMYWESFYNNIECFEGVKEFIIWNKQLGKKIGILTDYETEYQIIKLEKLGLLQYVDTVVTSEEVGVEKPSIQMFQSILSKMNLTNSDVIMIGDNYEKDILGANNADIFAFWFHKTNVKSKKYIEFNSFKILCTMFNNINKELINLEAMSRYSGERFDLVQAGGGNSSVKVDDWMFIKASGYNLTNVCVNSGYVIIDNKELKIDINKNDPKDVIHYNVFGKKRGSIETYMHSILKKYTLHLHPIQVNRILVCKQAEQIIQKIYPNSLVIDYLTPGIKISNEINKRFNNENVIFLINHGLIITCDDYNEVYAVLNNVLSIFEKYQGVDFERYKFTNVISTQLNTMFNINNVSYLCEDCIIRDILVNKCELFKERITFPDELIYCGVQTLFGFDHELIEEFKNKYDEPPKIIVLNNNVYITSHSISKCKEIEEVLKSKLMILDSHTEKNYLSVDEICFLNNWDAEKYRRLL